MKWFQWILGILIWCSVSSAAVVGAEAPMSLLGFSSQTGVVPMTRELPSGYRVPEAKVEGHSIKDLVIAAEGNPKTLFLEASERGLQQRLYTLGAVQANLYTLVFHHENEYRYAVYGTAMFDNRMFKLYESETGVTLPTKVVRSRWLGSQTVYTARALADVITAGVAKTPGYRLQSVSGSWVSWGDQGAAAWKPGPKKGSLWARIDADWNTAAGGHFTDSVYVMVYDDPDYGPAARFVLLNQKDTNLLWPRIERALFR